MQKQILLTSCSHTPGVDRWVRSLAAVKPSSFQPVIIMFEPFFDVPDGVVVYRADRDYPGNVKRFFPVRDIIEQYGHQRWYLWTDCADVVFQNDVVVDALLSSSSADGFFSTEGRTHEGSWWERLIKPPQFVALKTRTIYNAGCFLMRGDFFEELILDMHRIVSHLKTFPSVFDQLLLNRFIMHNQHRCADLDSVCLNIGDRYRPGDDSSEAVFRDGYFCRRDGTVYPVVHANGDNKDILNSIATAAGPAGVSPL